MSKQDAAPNPLRAQGRPRRDGRRRRARGTGHERAALQPIYAAMPLTADKNVQLATVLDPVTLLPKDWRTFRCPGSLTTPPCSERVKWNLIKAPVSVSAARLESWKKVFFFNARSAASRHTFGGPLIPTGMTPRHAPAACTCLAPCLPRFRFAAIRVH